MQFPCSVSIRISCLVFYVQFPCSVSIRISCLVLYVQFLCSVSIRISCLVFYVQFSCSVSTRVSCQLYRIPRAMSLFDKQKDQLSVISCSTCNFPVQITTRVSCQSHFSTCNFPVQSTRVSCQSYRVLLAMSLISKHGSVVSHTCSTCNVPVQSARGSGIDTVVPRSLIIIRYFLHPTGKFHVSLDH